MLKHRILHLLVMVSALLGVALVSVDAQTSDAQDFIDQLNERRAEDDLAPAVLMDELNALATELAETFADDPDASPDINALRDQVRFVSIGVGYAVATHTGRLTPEVFRTSLQQFMEPDSTVYGIGSTPFSGTTLSVVVFGSANECTPQVAAADFGQQRQQAETFLAHINAGRAALGLAPLTLDLDGMYAAAQWYSDDMYAFGYPNLRPGGVPHIGTDGSTVGERLERFGYEYTSARENILLQYRFDAQEAYEGWFRSPGHYANMMAEEVTEMALAYRCDPETGAFYYTQVLGTPFEREDLRERNAALVDALASARADANIAPWTVRAIDDPTLAAIAQSYAAANRFPDDMWDQLREAFDPIGRMQVLPYIGGQSATDAVAFLLSQRSDVFLSADYTQVALGSYFDDEAHRYIDFIFLFER